jgi:hypothetical protein
VSRSRHTDPRAIRAARRLAAPRAGRSQDDPSLRRRRGRWIKDTGGAAADVGNAVGQPVRPRVMAQRPAPGFHHPASRQDVVSILERIGPEAMYGIRSVELCRGPAWRQGAMPTFGRLCVPGRIQLYALPLAPWRVPGMLAKHDAALLAKAGAVVTAHKAVGVTLVEWPGDALRRFMLFDVLLHELGHHILQHHKGKRLARIARTRDHEAFAERFVAKCRAAWADVIAPA